MYKVVGFKNVDYVNKSGKRIIGTNLYLTYIHDNTFGVAVKEVYLRENVEYNPNIDDQIEIYYDEFKNVKFIHVVG